MTFMFYPKACRAALAVAFLAASPLAAEAAGEPVKLHRGASVTTVTPGSQALEVGRGPAVQISVPVSKTTAAAPLQLVAGRRLWLVDSEAGRVHVCTLRATTQVGLDAIRCSVRDLPRGVF